MVMMMPDGKSKVTTSTSELGIQYRIVNTAAVTGVGDV